MSDKADAALAKLARLWARERATTRERYAELRRGTTLRERVERGLAAVDLEIDDTDAAPGGRTLLWIGPRQPDGLRHARLGPGTPVRLWWDDPDEDDTVRGTVGRRRRGKVAVVVDDYPERLWDGGFRLDVEAPEATFDRGDRAVRRFREAPSRSDLARLREVLFGEEAPAFRGDEPAARWFDGDLNEPQRAAVRRALAAESVALVHGPPGTGKTRTLVEVVRQAAARSDRVLATAASNTAVDNLAERLARSGLMVVRLGHPARVSEAVSGCTLDAHLERTEQWSLARSWLIEAAAIMRRMHARRARGSLPGGERREMIVEARRLRRDARDQLRGAEDAILERAQVVCATAAGADSRQLRDRSFDMVVLDEATQAPDPMALVALSRGRRVVLAGDPCQLPPTVIDEAAAREGLGRTLFERLAARDQDAVRLLTVQHRMHAALMAYPSASMYGGALVAAPHVASHTVDQLPGVADDPIRPGPLLFIDTAGKGWDERRDSDDSSTSNPDQALRVIAEVRRLLGRGMPADGVGVIAPYRAQVRLMSDALAAEIDAGLEIGSVDGFQGREKEAIVLDLVRSNEAGNLGFLTETRRMNVALTRARRLLVVVGDSATLGRHPYYSAFMEAAEASGSWTSAWNDDAPPFGAD